MPNGARERSIRIQAVFTVFLLILECALFGLALGAESYKGALLIPRLLVTAGTFVAAVGVSAAVWPRRPVVLGLGGALMLLGAASDVAMLFPGGVTLDLAGFGPAMEGRGREGMDEAWPWMLMGASNVFAGAALLIAYERRNRVGLAALTFVRLVLWAGVFWQVVHLSLHGDLKPMFAGDAPALHAGLALGSVAAWALLLRGDRGWLRTLTTVSIARFILPVALVPVVGAYIMSLSARYGLIASAAAPLLNIELSSVGLILFGSAAVRSLWQERRARETLASTLERSPVIVHSETGLIEYWPRACEALYGFTAAEALGQRSDALLKTRFPVPVEAVGAALERNGEWAGELRQTRRDGKRIWIASRIVADRAADGAAPKRVETVTDITDLRLTRVALSESTANLTQAVETYGLGIVDHDATTNETRFSSEFERIVGAAPGMLGTEMSVWQSLMAPGDAERLIRWFSEDIAQRKTQRTVTLRVRRLDGQARDLSGVLRYRYTHDHAILRVVGIYMDVTEQLRDRAELAIRGERLLQLQSELNHTSRLSAMGEMAAALAHELNQPLTAVGNAVGAIELMLKDTSKPPDGKTRDRVLRAARHAESQTVRAGEIVRRLREFIVRGEADTKAENLDTLIEDAVALALPNPAAVDVQLIKSIATEASSVLADRVQIQQVVVNLVRNAVESMRPQLRSRRLSISAAAENGMALVRVEDNGPGVAPDMAERLFSAFLSTKREGMGVGLSICRRIVETHGGRMWHEPAEGGGAAFCFTIPLATSEAMNDSA
jgi:two-component system sensor kinase FixL